MMKILSGSARGRRIKTLPKDPLVRPILARIKKSVFDILRFRMKGSRFLDLYAGTGAVGLEALSEGAASAVFVEQDPKCVKLIHENIDHFKFNEQAEVFRLNATQDLSPLPKPFDLIFMGPPYIDAAKNMIKLVQPTIDAIHKAGLLAPNGIIIAQHHKSEKVESTAAFEIRREENYSETIVTFLKEPKQPEA